MVRKTMSVKGATRETAEPAVTVIKEGKCKTLTYNIGTDEEGGIQFKISGNTGGGFYSSEWVSYADIQAAFKAWPEDSPITSMALRPLFRGKSVNTPGFLVSVLCAERLLEPMPDRQRVHRACDPARFLDSIEELRKKAGITAVKKPAARSKAQPKAKARPKAKAKAKAAPKAKAPRKAR